MCMSHMSHMSNHLSVEEWRVGGVDGSHDDRPVWNTGAGSSGDVRHEGRQACAKRRVGQSSVDDLGHPRRAPATRRRQSSASGGGGAKRGLRSLRWDKKARWWIMISHLRTDHSRRKCAAPARAAHPGALPPAAGPAALRWRCCGWACGWSVEIPCMLTYGSWMHHRTLDVYTPTPY